MSSDPYIGTKLGNFEIVRLIGKGGMAGVYEAHQPSTNRNVAIKVMAQSISADESFVQRFKNEAQLIANLEHAHILPVYDFGEQEGTLYIVMRYLDAGTLEDRIGDNGMDIKEATNLFGQLASALDYAHSKGVIHRDLKPSNILIDHQGNSFLSDFGIAKSLEGTQNLTGTGGVVGTPTYMSPEQGLGGTLDARSDIYSLGVILFEMLTGRVPFSGDNPMQVMLKHINDQPPAPRAIKPDVSPAVESVILRALSKEPDARFESAKEMADSLQDAYEKGKTVAVQPFTSTMPVARVDAGATLPVTPVSPGGATMPAPVAGTPQAATGAQGAAVPGMVSTVGVPAAVGTAAPVATAAQPEVPYYSISAASQWLVDRAWLGRWIQAVGLSAATFLALSRLTPGDALQNLALAVLPGLFFYGLLNAPIPGGLIGLLILFPPLLAHAPIFGLIWLAGVALAALQMTSREMMVMMVSLIAAGTPFGWFIPLAAPWWLRTHRVAFGTAMGVIFASLFALALPSWPNAGGLLPTPATPSDFTYQPVTQFDTSYVGLLDAKVWQKLFAHPEVLLDQDLRGALESLGKYLLQIKLVPFIVAAAWAVASLLSVLFYKEPNFLMRGAGIGLGVIALVVGHLLHGWAGVQPPTTGALIAGVLMAPLAFLLTEWPIQAPPPPRPRKRTQG